MLQIFWRFLLLGCTSFGGPAAHIGYFRRTFVEQEKWLNEQDYAGFVALSQILPGPGSSQVGFAIGLHKGGIIGALLAFIGFTLPSFLLLYGLAVGATNIGLDLSPLFYGLMVLAVVVVADAVWSMGRSFCNTKTYLFLAILACAASLLLQHIFTQIAILILAASFGWLSAKDYSDNSAAVRANFWPFLIASVAAFGIVLTNTHLGQLFGDFYLAGSLVFGGGHVVLPLLQQSVTELDQTQFLVGYSAAQGVPGPMFSIASYLGAVAEPDAAFFAASVATIAIFLPGLSLMYGFVSCWAELQQHGRFKQALSAINAAVVGILAAALINPIALKGISDWLDGIMVVLGLFVLKRKLVPLWALIVIFAGYGYLQAFIN